MRRAQQQLATPATAAVVPPQLAALRWAGAALLIVLTAAVYYPCRHGAFIIDDHMLLVDSPLVKARDGLYRFWFTTTAVDYWPVFNSALWVQWRLWGLDSTGYHAVNIALHIVDALLLWWVLSRLAIPGAYLAALLFALHPVNVESVAWISQLKNLLAMTFALIATLLYVGADTRPTQSATLPRYVGSLAAFALAMLSKGSVVVLPLILLGITAWRRPLTRRDVARVAPFLVVGIGCALVTAWFRARFAVEAQQAGLVTRALEASAALWFYLSKAVLPIRLAFFYPKWHARPDAWQWWLPLLATIAVTLALWRARAGWARPLLLAWLFFGLALAPALAMAGAGFMEKWSVADHYQHLALIAVVTLIAAAWRMWEQQTHGGMRQVAIGVAALLVGAYATLSWRQSSLYADSALLNRASLENSPGSAFAHYNLGLVLLARGDVSAAQLELATAVQLDPDYADAHGDLGLALIRLQRLPEAIQELRQALRLRPDYVEAENNWGGALLEMGRPAEAVEHYERALGWRPDYADAHYNLGRALYALGRRPDAIAQFRRGIAAQPDNADIHNALGVALIETGERERGIAELREALRLNPAHAEARRNLDEVLAEPIPPP